VCVCVCVSLFPALLCMTTKGQSTYSIFSAFDIEKETQKTGGGVMNEHMDNTSETTITGKLSCVITHMFTDSHHSYQQLLF